jgi:uncharacterized 2Fe-2S/4Fe-4S cluster protein (DUF4445 family)
MEHYTVTFEPDGQQVFIHKGATIFEAAGRAGIILNSVCGGKGTCNKCKVYLEKEKCEVLACRHTIETDLVVTIPKSSRFFEQRILVDGISKSVETVPCIKKVFVDKKENFEDLIETLQKDLGGHIHEFSNEIVGQFEDVDCSGLTAVCHEVSSCSKSKQRCFDLIYIEPHDTRKVLYGAAVDIGTTTVVATLIDMLNGRCITTAAQSNPQIQYGDDVISRISYAGNHEGLKSLHRVIIDCLNELIDELCNKAKVNLDNIYELVAAGNTTMNHLLLGFPVKQLGQAPYSAHSTEAHNRNASELGLKINSYGNIHTISNIAGFVGSDTVAVAMAVGMNSVEKMTLAVDIGTNGELVLGTKEKLYAASCAAGPALEGARISQGSRAASGSIERVFIIDGDIDIDVIGGGQAHSICGSGLIDAIAVLLDLGVVDNTGRFVERGHLEDKVPEAVLSRIIEQGGQPGFVLAWENKRPGVVLTQKDVRETQLAKAAIRAGIRLLQKKMGLEDSDIQQILLAGAFGNYIRQESACRIGLLPNVELEKIHFVGNAASTGAQMVLLNSEYRKVAAELARKIEYVEIAHESEFQMVYAESLLF